MRSYVICCLALLASVAVCTNGVTTRSLITNFTCFKESHYVYAMVRAYLNIGTVDKNAKPTLLAGQAQKLLYADIYVNPCIQCNKKPEQQIDEVVDALKGTKYNMIWIMVQLADHWTSNTVGNCNYVKAMVAEAFKLGKTPGIGSDAAVWERLAAFNSHCKVGIGTELTMWEEGEKIVGKDCKIEDDRAGVWWVKHDEEQSFEHFKPFGGFTYPSAKEYSGPKTFCGAEVDLNFCNC